MGSDRGLRRRAPCAGLICAAALVAAAPALAQSAPAPSDQTPAPQTQPSQTDAQKKDTATAKPKPDASAKDKQDAKGSTTVKGVTVTGDNSFRSSPDRRSYDISKDLQTQSGASVTDALRNVPGVQVDLQGAISIRGDSDVTILVDGKPSHLGPLTSVPADQFSRVEVMTTPSAEFSPEGTAGIINLISKKTQPPGASGSVRASLGTDGQWRSSIRGSYQVGKLTLSGGVYANRGVIDNGGAGSSDAFVGGLLDTSTQSASRARGYGDNEGVSANLEYQFDPATRFNASIQDGFAQLKVRQDGEATVDDAGGTPQLVFDRSLLNLRQADIGSVDATLQHNFAGDQDNNLVIDLSQSCRIDDQTRPDTVLNLVPAAGTVFDELNSNNTETETDFQADYQRPMPGEGRFKTGYALTVENDRIQNLGFDGATSPLAPFDPAQTDQFQFTRRIDAAYVTYEQPIGKLTLLGGLRYESSRIDIDQVTQSITGHNDDARLYPTLHLGWQFTDAQQLQFGYSERIERPSPSEFDPFRVIYGPLNISAGNPDLKPEVTQSYEAGYQYRAGPTYYLATLFYKDSQRGVTSVNTDLGGGVQLSTQENLTRSKSAGLELSAAGRLTPTLRYNLSGFGSWNEIDAQALGFPTPRSADTYSGHGSIIWDATPKDEVQLDMGLIGKSLMPQGFVDPRGYLNVGYRHKISDHLSLFLTAQDVLDSNRHRTIYDSPDLVGENRYQVRDRAVLFSFTYSFGRAAKNTPAIDFGQGAN